MQKQTIIFTFEKETKNTIRYQEQTDGKPPVVGSLYVQKWALGTPVPEALQVTIFGSGVPMTEEVLEAVQFASGAPDPTPDSALPEPAAPRPPHKVRQP